MARSLSAHVRVAFLAVVGCATACSILLKEKPIPCSTDADCAKITGSHCDLAQAQCVSGESIVAEAGPDAPDVNNGNDATHESGGDDTDGGDGAIVDAPVDQDVQTGPATTPDWDRVRTFLENLYDDQQHLLHRGPGQPTFWATNDNTLATRAFHYLPNPDQDKSDAILARLTALKTCACGDNFGHAAGINHLVDPLTQPKPGPDGGADPRWIPLVPNQACFGIPSDVAVCNLSGPPMCPTADIQTEDHASLGWGPDQCHPSTCNSTAFTNFNDSGKAHGYADLLAYEILNYRNRNMDPSVLWANLQAKYDGIGVYDATADADHAYSTYKLALWKIAARVMGAPVPVTVDQKLAEAQSKATGGIRTQYAFNGDFGIASDQVGNVETTSFVVLAYLMPDGDF